MKRITLTLTDDEYNFLKTNVDEINIPSFLWLFSQRCTVSQLKIWLSRITLKTHREIKRADRR